MKVRVTMIAVQEYNITKKDLKEIYPENVNTFEDAVKEDVENYEEDPYLFLDDAKVTFTGEVL